MTTFDLADSTALLSLERIIPGFVPSVHELLDVASDADERACALLFVTRFFTMIGQSQPARKNDPLFAPGLPFALRTVARFLKLLGHSVGVIEPAHSDALDTFRQHAVDVRPLDLSELLRPPLVNGVSEARVSALYFDCPNELTGYSPGMDEFTALVEWCSERGVLLMVNFASRLFMRNGPYDHYRLLERTRFIAIEDTYSYIPAAGMGLSLTTASPDILPELERCHRPFWSPPAFLTALLLRVLRALLERGLESNIWKRADENRLLLEGMLAGTPFTMESPTTIGSQTIGLGNCRRAGSNACHSNLERQGVKTLSVEPFFLSTPPKCGLLRIALLREPRYLLAALRQLIACSRPA